MNAKKTKNYIYFLGFLLFFVFVFSTNNNTIEALANSTVETAVTKEVAPEIKLNVKSKTIVKEKSYGLRVYNVSETNKVLYKTSDATIATVDESGSVTGIALGTAVITVTVKDGLKTLATLTCDIIVGPPAISVKITKSELILVQGKMALLKTITQPYNSVEDSKFVSLDSAIASVSPAGRIKANELGNTFIYALIDNGKFDVCKVIVVDEETYQKMLEETSSEEESNTAEKHSTSNAVTAAISSYVTE